MANELFYSYGARFDGTYLGQSDDQQVDVNLKELIEYQSGNYAPGYVGAREAAPVYKLNTKDVAGVFDIAAAGVDDLHRDFSAGNVDWLYRAAMNRGSREAVASNVHYIYRMIQNALFYWDGFRADSKGEIEVNTMTIATLKGANPVTTLIPNQALPTASDVDNFFTLGKIVVNGVTLPRLQSLQWANNVKIEKELTDGKSSPTFAGIDTIQPECTFSVRDIATVGAFGFGGYPITANFDVYLRKRQRGLINYPDASQVHTRLRATTGTILFERTAGAKASANCKCLMSEPSGGGQVFTITQDVAIPA
jgi:hypothetical protein